MNRGAWIGKSRKSNKPWGFEIAWSGIFRGKEIHLNEGCRTSLKFNKQKSEMLYVQAGKVHVEFADEAHFAKPDANPARTAVLKPGSLLNVQAGCPYRLSALENSIVFEISDVKFGDDRVIIDDDYGRKNVAESSKWIFKPSED